MSRKHKKEKEFVSQIYLNGKEFRFRFNRRKTDNELFCESCPLNNLCCEIKDPRNIEDSEWSFNDFCLAGGQNLPEDEIVNSKFLEHLAPNIEDVLAFAKEYSPEVYKNLSAVNAPSSDVDGISLIKSKEDTYNLAQNGELIFSQWFSEIIPTKNGKYISNTGYVCAVPVGSVERCLLNVSDDTESRIMIGETEGDHRELLETLKEYV